MPRFAANLTMMYGEYPFPDRFAAAAKDGFTAVEYLFPYEYPANDLARWLHAARPDPGAASTPRLGIGRRASEAWRALPGKEDEFRAGIHNGS